MVKYLDGTGPPNYVIITRPLSVKTKYKYELNLCG